MRTRPSPQRGIEIHVEKSRHVHGGVEETLELQSVEERDDHARLRLSTGGAELVDFAEVGCVDQKFGERCCLTSVPFRDEVAGGVAGVSRRFSGVMTA